MFFKETKLKHKYNEANKIMEERGVFKKVALYITLMKTGKENEAKRIRESAQKEMGKILKEVGLSDSELATIQNNILNKNW